MVTFERNHARKPRALFAGAVLAALAVTSQGALAAPGAPTPPEPETPESTPAAEVSEQPAEARPDAADESSDGGDLEPKDDDEPSSTPMAGAKDRSGQKKKKAEPHAAAVDADAPNAFHAPVSVASDEEPLQIDVDLTHPGQVKKALLVFRSADDKVFRAVELRRGEPGPYVAVIPARYVRAPHVDYAIEIEQHDGTHRSVFGSRQAPHRVQIAPEHMDVIEAHVAKRVDDRRAVFWSGGEYVSFGSSTAREPIPGAPNTFRERSVDDRYFRVEGGFTYRLLRTVNEFGIRVGVVRGSAPVPLRELVPGQAEDERFDVGLNYGAPWVRFRLADHWHIDGSFLVNVTEVGFSAGTGGKLHVGDPYGSKLTVGFEAIQTFGVSIFTQLDIQAHEQIRVSPIVEVTNAPSADDFGMRLLAEVGWDIGSGFSIAGRSGYQARLSTSGGITAGGTLGYAF
jgi:hypothetical protein